MTRAAAALLVVCALANGARADGPFDACMADATRLLEGSRHGDATAAFDRCAALASDPDQRARVDLGRALTAELAGDLPAALHEYQRLLRTGTGPTWEARRREVEALVTSLRGRALASAGVVTLTTEPAGARVVLTGDDGRARLVAEAPLEIFIAAGRPHRLDVTHPERLPQGLELTLAAGEERRVNLVLEAPPIAPPEVPPAVRVHAPAPDTLGPWLTIGGGALVALAGLGFTLGAASSHEELQRMHERGLTPDDVPRDLKLRHDIENAQVASHILYIGGGVVVAAGITWLVLETRGAEPTTGPWIEPAPGGARVGWRAAF